MKQSKKCYGDAVQAILNTAMEKYCVHGDESMEIIVNLLNVAEDMAFMWDLKEIDYVEKYSLTINENLFHDGSDYRIYKENHTYQLVSLVYFSIAWMDQAPYIGFNSLFRH